MFEGWNRVGKGCKGEGGTVRIWETERDVEDSVGLGAGTGFRKKKEECMQIRWVSSYLKCRQTSCAKMRCVP